MKILVFTEGTIMMHKGGFGLKREEIVQQVKDRERAVKDYASYIPIGNAAKKIRAWKEQGADILYLTSRRESEEIEQIRNVLRKYDFYEGKLYFRKGKEEYKDVAERIMPNIIIEDDCESIGGEKEMTYSCMKTGLKGKIKSISVPEFAGIDHLPYDLKSLVTSY